MRLVRPLLALAAISISLTPAFAPVPASAQAPSAHPFPCTGNTNIVRVSDIKPGMMQKFLEASKAQHDWYKNAGAPDVIHVDRILVQDPATKAWSLSDTQALTAHIMPAMRDKKLPPHDAAWNAFVALFQDSSTIKTEYFTCVDVM